MNLNACRAYPTAKMVLEDPQARQYVGALAYHLYDGTAACLAAMADLSRTHKLPVWMTEYSREPGFEGSLEWAKQIHDLIVTYRVSAIDSMFGFFGDYDVLRSNTEVLIQVGFGAARDGCRPPTHDQILRDRSVFSFRTPW